MSKKHHEEKNEEQASLAEEISTPEGLEFPDRKKLEDQLTAMEMKLDEYKNEALRARAEVENIRRRAERDVSNAHKFGSEKLLSDLLPVIDSLVRGLESLGPQNAQTKAMHEGIALTLDLFEKTLAKHGMEVIEPKPGEPFNPDCHEAMSAMSDPDMESNTIAEMVQKGYQLNGRVLRAAMVVIIK